MLKYWRIAFALTLAIGATGPARAIPTYLPDTTDTSAPALVSTAQKAAQSGDCGTALDLVASALRRSGELAEWQRYAAYETGANCAVRIGKLDVAYGYALPATKLARASDGLWRMRLALELDTNQPEAAVTTVEAMNEQRHAVLNGLNVRWFVQIDSKLMAAKAGTLRRRLLAILTSSNYQPDIVAPVVGFFYQHYAELMIEDGNRPKAAALIAQISYPPILMELSVDLRFHDIFPATFDARASEEHWLAKEQEAAQRHPESLDLILEIAAAKRRLGDPSAALAILNEANPIGKGGSAYADYKDRLNWWWDGVGRTQQELGHYRDAIVAFRTGAALQEHGNANVSQAINLAEAQLRAGHAADALLTLAIFDRPGIATSPYGEMEMRFARGCAQAVLGKVQGARADIAYIKAHDSTAPQVLPDMLLCAGDLDGAARAIEILLADPSHSARTLLELSDYAPSVAGLHPDPVFVHLDALKARADIQAAIAKAGGIRRFDIPREQL